jgi:hypothetical protein
MQKFLVEMTYAGPGCRNHGGHKTIPLKAA